MKLLIDLLPCQTYSRLRGIGRYTISLMREMARLREANEFYALADAQLSEGFEELRQEFTRLLPAGSFLPYNNGLTNNNSNNSKFHRKIAETLILQAYQAVSPDVILTPNPFEMDQQGIVPSPNIKGGSYKQVGILYDLIPYIFQKQYLDGNPEYKKSYIDILNTLPNYDLLLAISEATRQDAINILKIKPEKIVNISGGVSSHFRKLGLSQDDRTQFMNRLGISRPFILYIGGNNFRKNMEGALYAYAQLPPKLIKSHQLVLNDAGDETVFRSKARSLGLSDQDIVVTGYTSDEDLVALYNLCKVFIFPSLYEGFGLPVIEAMACGAPVITSNNSSLPEVVGRSDMLFNASDNKEITTVLQNVLTDDSFREKLSEYGLERSKQFSWEKSAVQAWTAIEAAQKEKISNCSVVSNHSQQRPRIAYVSPLPPQKSGISYYSADLLPYLSKHFDIDLFVQEDFKLSNSYLQDNFSTYPWNKLLEMRDRYETVVYQYGNSAFHSHMFELERQFPGVLVLHDFYLSHLVAYVGMPRGSFQEDVDYSHGLKGLIDYQIKKEEMLWDWPINWNVLRYSREIIVHSQFQNKLLKQYYGRGWRPSPTIINQLRIPKPEATRKQQLEARKELGIGKDDFLFCSFGFLSPLKVNEMIIRAFSLAQEKLGKDTKVIFVGECANQEYHQQIMALIDRLGLKSQVCVTGFVNDENYKKYLISADVAIQLRKNSRGETSAAVLDCMTYGIPSIINSHGAFEDFTEDDVIKISDPVQPEELAMAMVRLRKDEAFRTEKGQRARRVVTEQHNPEQVAAAYAEVIHRAIRTDDRKLFSPLLDGLDELNNPVDLIDSSAKIAAKNLSLRCQPRLLIDVSNTNAFDARSGIQRVVKCLIREFFSMDLQSLHVELVCLREGQLYRACRFSERLFSLPEQSLGPEKLVTPGPGDTLFMLDSSWSIYDKFIPIFDLVRKSGGKVITMVYDLIPMRFPEVVDMPMEILFRNWLITAITQSDMMVCISRSTADDLITYISENNISLPRRLDVEYFHLGADIPVVDSELKIRFEVSALKKNPASPLFLMVGTLEPRKGNDFVVTAFEELWRQGLDYQLCIAGKVGWNVEKLEKRLRGHSELGKRLFFFENPTDAEINFCYQSATALIAASKAEGFGLPLIEAAQHQIPVLASDIPVFHEVGGEGAVYFSLNSPTCLADAVREMAIRTPDERTALAKRVKYLSWRESAAWMLDILEHNREYKEL